MSAPFMLVARDPLVDTQRVKPPAMTAATAWQSCVQPKPLPPAFALLNWVSAMPSTRTRLPVRPLAWAQCHLRAVNTTQQIADFRLTRGVGPR